MVRRQLCFLWTENGKQDEGDTKQEMYEDGAEYLLACITALSAVFNEPEIRGNQRILWMSEITLNRIR